MSVDVYVPFAGAPASTGTAATRTSRTTSTAFILLLLRDVKTQCVNANTLRTDDGWRERPEHTDGVLTRGPLTVVTNLNLLATCVACARRNSISVHCHPH